ncbi:MAG: CHAP domain-containing protein [Bifidobacteriaceae bacterium]|nr:CHAP domain-containing protein [Bifidobacteriaceae bacterium]
MTIKTRDKKHIFGAFLSVVCFVSCALIANIQIPQAQAVSWQAYQQKVQSNNDLKAKLAGVNADLANLILQLDDLTSNQIPAAQQAANAAADSAQQAQQLADSTKQRLESAQKDKETLEEEIQKTGEDYDDAKEAVANMARQQFHGSDASDVMEVVTNSATTQQFVNKMQSDAAVTRSEANAANDAADQLNTSMTRKQRLVAIEKLITDLYNQAAAQAASAKKASDEANAKNEQLEALRQKGTQQRSQLEAQISSLTSQQAREAAEIVAMKSQIDSYNTGAYTSANPNAGGSQQVTPSGNTSAPSGGTGGGSASGMDYAVPGGCPERSTFCYGHNTGNTIGGAAYPARQCTLWAYIRRSQLSLPVGSYMGNGADWANTGRRLGYLVNRTPHVGAAVVFARGQSVGGHWTADRTYGHVAIVERINADGSILISEGGTGFSTFPAYETLSNPGAYEYVHY